MTPKSATSRGGTMWFFELPESTPHPNLDRLSLFSTSHTRVTNRQTDTDHATTVTIGRVLCYARRLATRRSNLFSTAAHKCQPSSEDQAHHTDNHNHVHHTIFQNHTTKKSSTVCCDHTTTTPRCFSRGLTQHYVLNSAAVWYAWSSDDTKVGSCRPP